MKVKTWVYQLMPGATEVERRIMLKVALWLCLKCRDDEPLYEDRLYECGVWHREPRQLDTGWECDAGALWVEIKAGRLP